MEPGDRIILPTPAAVSAHYRSADLKTAPESTKSDLGHGVTVALRKWTKLGTMEHIRNTHKPGQLIPFSGKCGERQEVCNQVL